MPALPSFNQRPASGSAIVVTDIQHALPYLTTVIDYTRKDGEQVLIYGDGTHWTRPEDVTAIPDRMAALMADVCEGLHEYYPEALAEANLGSVYLAVMDAYADTGNSQADYEKLRDAVEAHANTLTRDEDPAPVAGI